METSASDFRQRYNAAVPLGVRVQIVDPKLATRQRFQEQRGRIVRFQRRWERIKTDLPPQFSRRHSTLLHWLQASLRNGSQNVDAHSRHDIYRYAGRMSRCSAIFVYSLLVLLGGVIGTGLFLGLAVCTLRVISWHFLLISFLSPALGCSSLRRSYWGPVGLFRRR